MVQDSGFRVQGLGCGGGLGVVEGLGSRGWVLDHAERRASGSRYRPSEPLKALELFVKWLCSFVERLWSWRSRAAKEAEAWVRGEGLGFRV